MSCPPKAEAFTGRDPRIARLACPARSLRCRTKHPALFGAPARPYHRAMIAGPSTMAEVAALVGDPARANILDTLLDGRAFTATELAFAAKVGAPTASAHLAKLVEARLLSVVKQGRHRYYRLASPLIARMLESIMAVAAIEMPPRYRPRSPRDEALLLARTCYDHLAGRLGVGIADALVARSQVTLTDDAGEVTADGMKLFGDLGIDLAAEKRPSPRRFCRPCLDWTERRAHLAGSLGAMLARRCFELGWIERRDSRAVAITAMGREGFRNAFGLDLRQPPATERSRREVAA
jgi:DNA-binding transcriptional ArsR family regulator